MFTIQSQMNKVLQSSKYSQCCVSYKYMICSLRANSLHLRNDVHQPICKSCDYTYNVHVNLVKIHVHVHVYNVHVNGVIIHVHVHDMYMYMSTMCTCNPLHLVFA